MSRWLRDSDQCFNPMIEIDNKVEGEFGMMSENSDVYPRIKKVLRAEEHEGSTPRDVPWLTKRIRYRGKLHVPNLIADWFPLDVQRLPITIVALQLPSRTTLGLPRMVKLLDPSLRYEDKMYQLKKARILVRDTIAHHHWPETGLMLGEMSLVGFGWQDPKDSVYQVDLLLIRITKRYLFDFMIQVFQVVCACFSCWVPFTSDCLANRLSITLTVILTLVAFTTQRPPVIDELPYPTFHDTFEQYMVMFAVIVALENLVASSMCVDGEVRNEDQWLCQQSGSWTSSRFDTIFIVLFGLIALIMFPLWQVMKGQTFRIAEVLKLHTELHEHDEAAARRAKIRMRRIRSAFPKESFDIVISDISQLESLREVVDARPDSWVVLESITINWHLLLPGHIITTAEDGRARSNSSSFSSTALSSLWNATQLWSPVNLCVSEEDISEDAVSRLMIKPDNVFVPYNSTSHAAVRVMHVIPFFSTWFSGFWLRLAKRRIRKKQATLDDMDILSGSDVDAALALGKLHSTRRESNKWNTFKTKPSQIVPGEPEEKESTEVPSWMIYNLHRDPCELTFILDIGTGEIGFYGYIMTKDKTVIQAPNAKRKIENTFFTDYLKNPNGVEKMGDLAVEMFLPVIQAHKANNDGKELSDTEGKCMVRPATPPQVSKNVKVFAGCTGANRVALMADKDLVVAAREFFRKVGSYAKEKRQLSIDFLLYSPESISEAEYELCAVDFLVQRANLNVENIPLGPSGQQFAGFEIDEALQHMKRDLSGDSLTLMDFIREFKDLKLNYQELAKIFTECKTKSANPKERTVSELYLHVPSSPVFLRSIVRARLFCGTLSAGGGSSQFTFKSTQNLSEVIYHSIPVGNKVPIVTGLDGAPAIWGEKRDLTQADLEEWRGIVKKQVERKNMPRNKRGFFVGISAIAYAAKAAKIADRIVPRDVFLQKIDDAVKALDRTNLKDRLTFSNLIMVYELVDWVLNRNAFICCKREWQHGSTEKFVATWSFGFWLKSTQTR
eukprot:GEMP01001424.1.p1 GENE.GEMP01001424.1~~GEMP01001424.1.p1  ORF type:complete len:1011 (+),score=179.60 GEMP01001424.1:380-3412(+)